MKKITNGRYEVEIGAIYLHGGNKKERYVVLDKYPSATGYEKAGKLSGEVMVVYRQLYDGKYPKGFVWTREELDFLNNFTYLEKSSVVK